MAMGKKVIVAGMGHGGIAAAALLAQAGFDVTVYEQKEAGKLGYDWTDIFAPARWGSPAFRCRPSQNSNTRWI
ncbi:MAG: NAD(P)-binding protein [Clostridia bacterium]|nr:NAD(P)-binding protein [Clostridia bacterium]